jgi:bifunctional non-homologous end joining protein LigD
MTDIFDAKEIKPMLIGEMIEAFDSPDYIFELKLDGERCIAYLDPKTGTELRNKRNMKMLSKVPELSEIHKQVKHKCILDGELIVIKDGKPDFSEIQRRSLTTNNFKIKLQANKFPASFTAFDILYYKDHEVASLPLMERIKLLESTIKENEKLAISRHIEERGIEFYKLSEQNDLEGIVAKRKDSKYIFDKRTTDWIKIKNLQDDDFVVCGYILKDNNVISVVLGQFKNDILIYKGHCTLGVSSNDFRTISSTKKLNQSPFNELPSGNDDAVWIEPKHVCTVKYMMKTATGSMRQPVVKGIRDDKEPDECVDKN